METTFDSSNSVGLDVLNIIEVSSGQSLNMIAETSPDCLTALWFDKPHGTSDRPCFTENVSFEENYSKPGSWDPTLLTCGKL